MRSPTSGGWRDRLDWSYRAAATPVPDRAPARSRRHRSAACERETQQVEGFVAVLVQRAQRAVQVIAPDLEAHFNRVVFQPLVEGLAVEIAGALVEHVGGEIGGAGFVRLVLGGAAVESIVERNQRHGLFAHQPRLDAGRADDLFDGHRRGGRRAGKQREPRAQERSDKPSHERFSACGLTSLIR